MRKYRLLVFVVLPILILTVMNATASNRTALVIGNGAYQSTPLRNPVNDAGDMANVLFESGFKVILKINASQREMETAMRAFGKALRKGGIGLFYYAGHGLQLNGTNYLIPVDAQIETESDVKYEAVDAGRILGKMEDAGNNLNIVILDACRNNPFARSFRSSTAGLARMDAPTGSLVAYATAPGKMAADGDGRNGIYSKHLIRNIRTPGLTIEQVLKNVRVAVAAETSNKQVPWESSSLMGNFYFNANGQESVQPAASIVISEGLKAEREQLEQEKRELGKIKSEMAEQQKLEQERKQIEAEKQKLLNSAKVASINPVDKEPAIAARKGQYVKYKNNIVYDRKNDLEWFAGPDEYMKGYKAKSWVQNLTMDGGGWRMPSNSELKGLYNELGGKGFTSLFDTSARFVWSSVIDGVNFYSSIYTDNGGYACRAFAVRSRK